jgi:DNA-binding beta-propeller fold protein YncE
MNTSRRFVALALLLLTLLVAAPVRAADAPEGRRLYVATPGIRNYLDYGGHGLVVYDIDHGHRFLKRIPTGGLGPNGEPLNVKGVCANAQTGRIYVSTIKQLMCIDLVSEKLLWEKTYEAGCDRMSMSPDGRVIYLPSFEGPIWYVVNAESGDVLSTIRPDSGAHNTVFGPDGNEVYLAGLRSPLLTIADAARHVAARTVGPFSASVRPFTVNRSQTLCFANVNELLGFEIGDLKSGRKLHRVEVPGFQKGPTLRHGCPSHGIGLTPDESEIWVCDSFNKRLHLFDATAMPPKALENIALRDEPGWVTFSIAGDYAYPSTGEVIDTRTRKIVAQLADEKGAPVSSEKVVEVDFSSGRPIRAGDQFGIGRKDSRKRD